MTTAHHRPDVSAASIDPTTRAALQRRGFLRLALATGIGAPLATGLASCAASGSSTGTSSSTSSGTVSADNPFGMAADTTVDAVIFDGGYGTDYVDYAGTVFSKLHSGSSVKVTPSTQIAQQMQPRFVGGNPPDLLDDTGAQHIGLNTIAGQLADLTDVTQAKNLEGTTIADTLYPGVLKDVTLNGKLAAINYVLTVFAVWYSKSLFDANGWTPPKTWDEAMTLGAEAKKQGKYLFTWGKEAASYYTTMVIDSAITEGGDQVRVALANLEPNSWSQPAVQKVLTALKQIIDAGYMKPGGAGTQFTAAQAQWSQDEAALLYPSGSWIENEMKSQTKSGFEMTGFPTPTVTTSPAMPQGALHVSSDESYVVPSQAKSSAGGKELLRVMLSKDAAANFAKTRLASTIVKDTVPPDAFGSTALKSQLAMLQAAGQNTYSWAFIANYGMTTDMNVLWNTFLAGNSSVAELTKGLQQASDKVRNDSSIPKITVS